nr:MAG TPA: hypothetical protein [Caudoviricetes sp.]
MVSYLFKVRKDTPNLGLLIKLFLFKVTLTGFPLYLTSSIKAIDVS